VTLGTNVPAGICVSGQVAEAEVVGEGEAGVAGLEAGGAGGVLEGGGGGADAEAEAVVDGEVVVEAEEEAGGEGVAGAGGAADPVGGEAEGRVVGVAAVGVAGDGAFGDMNDDPFVDAELEEAAGGGVGPVPVDGAAGRNVDSGGAAGLEFVEAEEVHVGEGGGDEGGEAVAVLADHVDGGAEAAGAGLGEHAGRDGGAVGGDHVEGVEEEEVAEVEDAGGGGVEVEVGGVEAGVGAAAVEEGAAAAVLDGHHVGVGGGGLVGDAELGGVDAVGGAILEDGPAVGVATDEAAGGEGERGAELGEIEQHVVGGAAGAGGFLEDGGEGVLFGPAVDDLDMVDDPVAGGEDPGTGGGGGAGHRRLRVIGRRRGSGWSAGRRR
jgi:hypothetical protein